MEKNMSDELTMEQMEQVAGGNPLVFFGGIIAGEASGATSFYINLIKNLADGQDFSEAAHCAGETAGVAGMEDKK